MAYPERRRRRLRHGPSAGSDDPTDPGPDSSPESALDGWDESVPVGRSVVTAGTHDPTTGATEPRRGYGGGAPAEDRDGERGLRGLIGSGASQVSVRAALRARDAARPTDADLAEAEERLVVVRRNWVPREELPRNGR
jgi:hypothetical protein